MNKVDESGTIVINDIGKLHPEQAIEILMMVLECSYGFARALVTNLPASFGCNDAYVIAPYLYENGINAYVKD